MTIVCLVVLAYCPMGHSLAARLCRVGVPVGALLATYFGLARAFRMDEIVLLFRWHRPAS